jgi:nucleotide-binding universal stress UspA family protein
MARNNSLIVALDFREGSLEICHEAIILAKYLESEVTFVHAVEYMPYYPYYPYNEKKIHEDLILELTQKLDQVKIQFTEEGITVNEHIIEEGNACEIICNTADKINARGIIVGVGEHHILENLIGSTANKIANMSKQPVYLINPKSHTNGVNNIICAYDFSENSDKALTAAIKMANVHNAHLDIVHIVHEHYYFNPIAPIIDPASAVYVDYINEMKKAEDAVHAKLDHALEELHISGVDNKIHICKGDPVLQIFKKIEELGSQLLVLGASGHSTFIRFMLGSTSEKIIRKSPCSVMTIKDVH